MIVFMRNKVSKFFIFMPPRSGYVGQTVNFFLINTNSIHNRPIKHVIVAQLIFDRKTAPLC